MQEPNDQLVIALVRQPVPHHRWKNEGGDYQKDTWDN